MGQAKDKFIGDHEKGFNSGSHIYICADHFEDLDIEKLILNKGNRFEPCFFCQQDSEAGEIVQEENTIHFDELLHVIVSCIRRSYDDPANGLAFESAEGGYIGETYDTLELLNHEIELDADYEVIEQIAGHINQEEWTEIYFYGESFNETLSNLWNNFSYLVRHKVRYLFNETSVLLPKENENDKPLDILNTIAEYIIKVKLFVKFPQKTHMYNECGILFRARQHKIQDQVVVCKDICSPPPDYAAANRFSAEGISMFYGAGNEKAAIEEIINRSCPNEFVTIAKFYPAKTLTFIDLRNEKKIGFFDYDNIDLYDMSQFLVSFVNQVSKKLTQLRIKGLNLYHHKWLLNTLNIIFQLNVAIQLMVWFIKVHRSRELTVM